jgi:circadian clock protein KaiB
MGTKADECVLPHHGDYVLRLFVTGHTRKSARAVQNITEICEAHLNGRYDLEIVDIYQQPDLALEHNLVAAPTLMKLLPLPPRSLVGDMSDRGRVLAGLGVVA